MIDTIKDHEPEVADVFDKLKLPQLFKEYFQRGLIEVRGEISPEIVFYFMRMNSREDTLVWKELKTLFPNNQEFHFLSETGCQKVVLTSNGEIESWS